MEIADPPHKQVDEFEDLVSPIDKQITPPTDKDLLKHATSFFLARSMDVSWYELAKTTSPNRLCRLSVRGAGVNLSSPST